MTEGKKSGATLLTPGKEYEEYLQYCTKNNFEPVSEGEFYRASYYLAARGLIAGFAEGVAASCFGETTVALCKISDEALVLALFSTKELEEQERKAAEDAAKVSPTDHLG